MRPPLAGEVTLSMPHPRVCPVVTLLPTQHKSPETTHRFCSDTQDPGFSHTMLGTMGVMLHPADHHLH